MEDRRDTGCFACNLSPGQEGAKDAKRLSSDLYNMLTADDAQPDGAAVMAKIEQLEVTSTIQCTRSTPLPLWPCS